MTTRSLAFAALFSMLSLACGPGGPAGGTGGGSGATPVEYSLSGGQYWSARFSPDGTRLAVQVATTVNAKKTTGVVDLSSKAFSLPMGDAGEETYDSAWLSNDRIVYDRGLYSVNPSFAVVNVKTGAFEPLFSVKANSEGFSDVAADGGFLVRGGATISALFLDGTTRTLVTFDAGVRPDKVRLSLDGTQVAWVEGSQNDVKVFVAATDGGVHREVFTPGTYLASLAWFPDGKRLAVSATDNIVSVQVDGSGTPVVLQDQFAARDIDVSRDGKQLVYAINGSTALRVLPLK